MQFRSMTVVKLACLFLLILTLSANTLAIEHQIGLGLNLGYPHLIGFDLKYLLSRHHQLYLSYLLPTLHGVALGVKSDVSLGYNYEFRGEEWSSYFGGQLRYWRFDLDDSVAGILIKAFADFFINVFTFGETDLTEEDVFPVADAIFLGTKFGVERRRGRSALGFDLEILGTTLFAKWGKKEIIPLNFDRAVLFPYFNIRYTYYF